MEAVGPPRVPWRNRIPALIAIACVVLLIAWMVLLLATHALGLIGALIGLTLIVAGGWSIVTERMPRRGIGMVVAAVGALLVIGSFALTTDGIALLVPRLAVVLGLSAAALAFARVALDDGLHAADLLAGVELFAPRHPVLLCNESSGGGRVGDFGLLDVARSLDVETVILRPGDDLVQLARDAVARGADCLGMAGGDGSQALVASVAAEAGLPFVCIPAGTRNHFALDLGIDREDPRRAMAAFTRGALRSIDYATIGDRLFVNNVSLGVYATIIQQEGYRDAKLATSRELLPDLVGRSADAFDLQFTMPDGEVVDDVFLILVSNNPYVIGPSLNAAQRPSLTTGALGVVAVRASSGGDAVAALAQAMLGRLSGGRSFIEFTAEEFEVRSQGGVAYAGIDGEALELSTPLVFTIHARGLTALVPRDSVAKNRRQRAVDVRALVKVALGRRAG